MSSTLLGRSGRAYVRKSILQAHPQKPQLSVYLAYCDDVPYVLKRVSTSIFAHSQELKNEFGDNSRIRTHLDENTSNSTLVYKYFQNDLYSLMANGPDLSREDRKYILREVGLAVRDLHDKNWVHLDIKPNNVLVDWSRAGNGLPIIERVALSDLDCALRLRGNKLLNHRMGNVMWRSPEAQTGKGVGKPSDVFSFGLLLLYTITSAETLHPDFEQFKREGTEPEPVILYKQLSMFGPVPRELIRHINDIYWGEMIEALSAVIAEEDPSMRLAEWKQTDFPSLTPKTKGLISRLNHLDPNMRGTMQQILQDSWWISSDEEN